MKEFKPCPFCGNETIHVEYDQHKDGNKGYFVYCNLCDVEQFTCCDEDAYGRHEAVEKWNTRQSRPLKCEVE